MSQLKNKSDFNNAASQLLFKNSLHASSVHCAYYRCIQFMLHILFNKIKMSKIDFQSKRQQRKGGTHGTAIYLIQLELLQKNREEYKSFQALIPKLKEYREISDYEDVEITSTISSDALNKSDSIMNILTANFR